MPAPQLRVFRPERREKDGQTPRPLQSSPPLPASQIGAGAGLALPTLREAWERFWLAEKQLVRSQATIREDLTALKCWESACARIALERHSDLWKDTRTTNPSVFPENPPIDLIDRDLLVAVRNVWLEESNSRDTYRKRFNCVRKTLKLAEERELIGKVPKLPEIPGKRRIKGFAGPVSLEEVDALYNAADAAAWPAFKRLSDRRRFGHIAPALWWRAWLVCWWIYGLRTEDVAATSGPHAGLFWSHLSDRPRCPVPGIRIDWEPGWLMIIPEKTARTKGQPIICPRHPVEVRHLQPFAGLDPLRVFPLRKANKKFYETWRVLRETAGVDADVTISGSETNKAGEHQRSIRKGCSNNWDDASAGLGKWILGHADGDTNGDHYRSIAEPMVKAVQRISLPPSFLDERLLR